MRFKLMSLMIAIVAALSSCNRHESVLTGSYGGRVVAGQVVMASEVADNSPAGVEVAVVGTGMSATLAADGHFLFAGVPDDVELTFRRADGIDVRTRVAAAPSLFIELGKTTASNSGRRRGVGQKDPKPSQEIEGVIQTAGADSIVVLDSHQQLDTVSINDATLIRKGNQTLLAADLKEGDRVHVKAMLKDDKLTALQIVVQNAGDDDDDDDREHGQEVEGLIVQDAAAVRRSLDAS